MKHQINLLCQLQELILTRDEHHHTGDGTHLDSLNDSIDALVDKLEPQPKTFYQRLYKKDHLVMSPMVDGCCGVCGMRLPVSQVLEVDEVVRIDGLQLCLGRVAYIYLIVILHICPLGFAIKPYGCRLGSGIKLLAFDSDSAASAASWCRHPEVCFYALFCCYGSCCLVEHAFGVLCKRACRQHCCCKQKYYSFHYLKLLKRLFKLFSS